MIRNASTCGFTLIEILVVITLISMAVAIVAPDMFLLWKHFDENLIHAKENYDTKKQKFINFIKDEPVQLSADPKP